VWGLNFGIWNYSFKLFSALKETSSSSEDEPEEESESSELEPPLGSVCASFSLTGVLRRKFAEKGVGYLFHYLFFFFPKLSDTPLVRVAFPAA
jgi:hypothetical protein